MCRIADMISDPKGIMNYRSRNTDITPGYNLKFSVETLSLKGKL